MSDVPTTQWGSSGSGLPAYLPLTTTNSPFRCGGNSMMASRVLWNAEGLWTCMPYQTYQHLAYHQRSCSQPPHTHNADPAIGDPFILVCFSPHGHTEIVFSPRWKGWRSCPGVGHRTKDTRASDRPTNTHQEPHGSVQANTIKSLQSIFYIYSQGCGLSASLYKPSAWTSTRLDTKADRWTDVV